jgi:VanZ family protein
MLLPERVFRALCLSAAIAMALFVLVGARKVGEVGSVPGPYLDKIVHGLYYGVMAVLVDRGFGGRLPVVAMAIAIAVGGADEVHQMSVPGREASVADWIADVMGAVVLTLLWRAARRAGRRRT